MYTELILQSAACSCDRQRYYTDSVWYALVLHAVVQCYCTRHRKQQPAGYYYRDSWLCKL
jgi:hypothetical protein